VQFAVGEILWDVVQIYNGLILLWCLLSWFPSIRWYDQPWKTLDAVVQPILAPFRKFIPPINGIDLSPMIATAVLYFLASNLRALL
jgi:YggT family protein